MKNKNAQVTTLILNFMDQNIVVSVRPFKTASDIWRHYLKIYSQINQSRKFDIEFDIAKIN
jgi:hypothetical protein